LGFIGALLENASQPFEAPAGISPAPFLGQLASFLFIAFLEEIYVFFGVSFLGWGLRCQIGVDHDSY
jgi:hypothetical protein